MTPSPDPKRPAGVPLTKSRDPAASPFGPYGTGRFDPVLKCWRGWLSEEGQAFLLAWLAEYPVPAKVLTKAHRNLVKAARTNGIGRADLGQLCHAGCVRAALTYRPDGFKFVTYAVWYMRAAVQVAIPKPLAHGKPVLSGPPLWAAMRRTPADVPPDLDPEDRDRLAAVARVVRRSLRMLTPREREAVSLYYGLDKRHEPSLRDTAAAMGTGKANVGLRLRAARRKMRPVLERKCLELL